MVPAKAQHPKASGSLDIEQLSEAYALPLLRYFSRNLTDPHDAEDMVQDVFTRLVRLDDYERIEYPQSFLFQIASNLLKDRRRRDHTRHSDQHETFDDMHHAHEVITPERVLMGKQELEKLKQAIMDLPPKPRSVFILHRFDELKYREISEALGMSISAVEKHMIYALSKLSKRFKRR